MKVAFQIFIILSFLFVFSCEKKEIPEPDSSSTQEPDNSLTPEQSPMFYVSGNFNGDEQIKVVDGEMYTANSHSQLFFDSSGTIGDLRVWTFEIINNTSEVCLCPEIIFNFYSQGNSYEDLILATDNSQLNFLNINVPNGYLNGLEVLLFEDNHYFSSSISFNSPMLITKSMDTIVDNIQYRILELEGDISLEEGPNLTPYQINGFKARIAFSY